MTDTENTSKDRISVGIEADTTAVSFDGRGNTATSQSGDSLNQGFDRDGEALTDDELDDLDGAGEGAGSSEAGEEGQSEAEGDGGDTTEETDEAGEEVELPEWDGEDEAVGSAYDGKYITKDEDGKDILNFEAFNAEFAKDRGDGKRDLNAGTRKYLKDRFGISDKVIDSHLAGVIAQEKVIADTFHTQFGPTPEEGKQVYDQMFGWAKETYSPAQKARYNAAMKEGGEAAQEQIELLKTRFLTKNPAKASEGGKSDKPSIGLKRRAVTPQKNATGGKPGKDITVSPFANAEEHRHAQNEALQLSGKDRDAKLAEVRKRLEASSFWKA